LMKAWYKADPQDHAAVENARQAYMLALEAMDAKIEQLGVDASPAYPQRKGVFSRIAVQHHASILRTKMLAHLDSRYFQEAAMGLGSNIKRNQQHNGITH
jgi:hypothetical protein